MNDEEIPGRPTQTVPRGRNVKIGAKTRRPPNNDVKRESDGGPEDTRPTRWEREESGIEDKSRP